MVVVVVVGAVVAVAVAKAAAAGGGGVAVVVLLVVVVVVVVVRLPPRCDAPELLFFGLVAGRRCCVLQYFLSVVIESGNCSWFRVYFCSFSNIVHQSRTQKC